ncbi:hypothetical protein ACFT9I_11705 [Streptomyces sp. NPDC057137]|uniref:hypothetical protein n=1 Tax=Streptomyces sp. NPDC057137 TaxID=3346030 RepID=UPI0036404A89
MLRLVLDVYGAELTAGTAASEARDEFLGLLENCTPPATAPTCPATAVLDPVRSNSPNRR